MNLHDENNVRGAPQDTSVLKKQTCRHMQLEALIQARVNMAVRTLDATLSTQAG